MKIIEYERKAYRIIDAVKERNPEKVFNLCGEFWESLLTELAPKDIRKEVIELEKGFEKLKSKAGLTGVNTTVFEFFCAIETSIND